MSFENFFYEKNEMGEDDVKGAIIDFFASKEKPTDDEVHALAKELGVDKHKFEEIIYEMLSSFWNAGLHKEKGAEEVDEDELKKGIKVEMEHTTSEAIARRIALDHLAELPDYYTRLAKMEGEH